MTADGKRTKIYEAKGWKQHVDQVQHHMLVANKKKGMLLLTDPEWNLYVIDMVADETWQKDTLYAGEFVSALSKKLLSFQYLTEGGIGVRVPSLQECMLSTRGTVVSSTRTKRHTSTKKTSKCKAGYTLHRSLLRPRETPGE
jgi:hypothetical protein